MKSLLLAVFYILWAATAFGTSDIYPKVGTPPTVASFLPSPAHTYYCATTGSNTTGDGSIGNPWVDLIGAAATVGPGDLIYFRGGTYPAYAYSNFSRSQNMLSVDGTLPAPIVITNYPGEIVKWDSVDTIWSLTLDGDYQKLIGTKVGAQYGIQITGGISIRANNVQVSGVDFIGGTSNGGDLNPAMLSVPLNDGCDNLVISHCSFRDSAHQSTADRMACIRLFRNTNSIIEYNVFKNNLELDDCASVYYKDNTQDSIVRWNTFVDSVKGVQYFTQDFVGGGHDGLDVYGNLFYNVEYPFLFRNEFGANVRIHDNVALQIPATGAFFYYLNAEPDGVGTDHGQYWNNVIEGTGFEQGWHANSANAANLPDVFDYNLWKSALDRNAPWGDQGYHAHAVTNATLGITYNTTTLTATASDTYPGRSVGLVSSNIGGFSWNAAATGGMVLGSGLTQVGAGNTRVAPIP